MESSLAEFVGRHLAEPQSAWAIGTFGAVAEYQRDALEPATVSTECVVTARGGIRLRLDRPLRVVAWESPGAGDGWRHGVAFCLGRAESAMNGRQVLTELGPDRDALLPEDREAALFDLGVGAPHCDVCVRVSDPAAARLVRSAAGRTALDAAVLRDLRAISPVRVFLSRLGRVEVRTPIPPPDGRTPDGPHTHLLPRLLARRRTHSANLPLPEALVPCAELFPASAMQDEHGRRRPFDGATHERFQALLDAYGDPAWVSVKRETAAAVRARRPPRDEPSFTRAGRLARRVALRQLAQTDGDSPSLRAWRKAFDREAHRPAAH